MNPTAELFAMAGIWCLIAAVACRYITPSWPGRVGLFAVLVGIPFWELPIGYLSFRKVCYESTAAVAYERIPKQSTLCADYPFVTFHEVILKAGFKTAETRGERGEIFSVTSDERGSSVAVRQTALSSKYCATFENDIRMPWRVYRNEVRGVSVDDGRVVARQSRYTWAGMWWQESMRPIFGRGGSCSGDSREFLNLFKNGAG